MRLRELRLAAGMRQEDLAEKVGVDQATISYLETSDDPNPTWRTLKNLAKALKCRPEEIMCCPSRHKVAR